MPKKGKGKKKKGLGQAKTQEKTQKNKLKALKKEFGEDDLDTILKDIKKVDSEQKQVNISTETPSPRSNATLTPHPTKDELILFGGQYYDGRRLSCFNDLFVYNIAMAEWRKI